MKAIGSSRLLAIVLLMVFLGSCGLDIAQTIEIPQEINYQVGSLEEALSFVRNKITYVDDQDQYGGEYWQMPEETYQLRRGDCEDYALLLLYFTHTDLGMDSYLQLVGPKEAEGPTHALAEIDGVWYEPILGWEVEDPSVYKAFRRMSYVAAVKEIFLFGEVEIY